MRAYKTELDPTPAQIEAIERAMGAARWCYNWALAQKIEDIRARAANAAADPERKIRSGKTLDNELRVMKEQPEYSWLNDIASHVRQAAIAQCDAAIKNFFDALKRNKGAGVKNRRKRGWAKRLATHPEMSHLELLRGFPEFKSRKRGDKIGIRNFSYRINDDGRSVHVAKIGAIKLKECSYLPAGAYNDTTSKGRLMGLTISARAGRYFASVQVETSESAEPAENLPVKAVHFGVRVHCTTSDGKRYENPRALMRLDRKLRRLQRTVSRRQPDSKRREKAKSQLAKLHYRISCTRNDAIHKMTHDLTREPSVIVVESWNVAGMLQNDGHRTLHQRIADASMSEAKRQLVYKASWYGSRLIETEPAFPSSSRCSVCGTQNASSANVMFHCSACGAEIEREDNAVENLKWLAASHADTLNARGGDATALASAGEQRAGEAGTL